MATCPGGHRSQDDDWCDQCGLRITAPPAADAPPQQPGPRPAFNSAFPSAPAAPGEPTATVETCPSCGTPREGAAAFCEECRHNFGSAGSSSARPAGTAAAPRFPPPQPPFPPLSEHTASAPSRINRPAEPLSPDATITGEATGRPSPVPVSKESDSGDFLLSPPDSGHTPTSEQSQLPPAAPRPAAVRWTAVVTADREYFTTMMGRSGAEATGLFFPQYSPELRVPMTESQMTIGRRRHSTGEAPAIDLSRSPEDPGVSHRHAVLVRRPDGGWSVIDQDSTNGTTVNLGEDPIAPFRPVDLDDGDRVHVGAWTTITLRRE
jgi:FHA domain